MSLLTASVLRSAWRMRYRLVALCLVAAAGFGVYVGVYSAIDSLLAERDHAFSEGNLADLEFRFAPEDLQRIPDLSQLEGIAETENRLVFPGQLQFPSAPPLFSMLVTSDPKNGGRINRIRILEGNGLDASHPEAVVIDRNLASFHHLHPGDSLKLILADETYNLRVAGIGLSAEFLLAPANPRIFIPSKGSLGVLYAVPGLIQDRVGIPLSNSLLVKIKPGANADEVQSAIQSGLENVLLLDQVIPASDQFGSRFLELSLNAFRLCLPAMVIVFDLTAFLVTLFLIFQWVAQERREIGTLMAMGYGRIAIGLAYLVPVLCICAGAILAGLGVAWTAAILFASNYARSIGFPIPEVMLGTVHLVLGIIGVGVVLLSAVGWPLAWLLRLTPLEAVRDAESGGGDHMGFLGHLLAWMPGKVWLRYGARNLVRNKLLSAMTILAVGMGLGVTVSFFINLTSNATTAVHMTEGDPWDAILELFAPVEVKDASQFEAVEGVKKAVPICKFSARLVGPAGKGNIAVGGVPAGSGIRNPEILEGRPLQEGDTRSVILERNLARQCGLQVGSPATISYFGKETSVEVVGILSGALPGEAYTPLPLSQEILGMGDMCMAFFLMLDGDHEMVRKALLEQGNVAQVTLKSEIVSKVLETTGEKIGIIRIGAAFSVFIALLFIFCSVSFTVLKRKQEYVMLRILGFSDGTVALTIIIEVMVLGALAVLLAVPVGYGAAVFLNDRVSEAWFNVTLVAEPGDFLRTLIPGFLLMPIAAIGAIRQVLREPMDKSLRERRCG